MKGETFEIELVDGTKKQATLITIIKSEENFMFLSWHIRYKEIAANLGIDLELVIGQSSNSVLLKGQMMSHCLQI